MPNPSHPDEAGVPAGRPPIFYGYWLVGAAFIGQMVSAGMQSYIFGAFLKPMADDLDWTRAEFTLARTVGMVVTALIGLYIGGAVDRRGGRLLMQVGIVVLAVALFACSYVTELWQWIVLNGVILSIGAAMIGNLVVNVTLAKWFVEKRGRAVGFAAMGVSFAGITIAPLCTLLIDEFGWPAAWRILAAGSLVLILPISFLMRRAPEDYGLHPDGKTEAQVAAGGGARAAADYASSFTRAEAIRTPAFYLVVFAFGLGVLSVATIVVQTIPYMTDAGYSARTAALMVTLPSIPSFALKPVWGYLIDRTDVQRLSVIGFIIAAISLTVIVFSVRAGFTPGVFIGFFFLGCGWGGYIPLQEVVWAAFFGRRYLGAVRSAALPITLAIGAVSPLLTSLYYDVVGNYDGAFLGIAVCALIAVVLMLLAKKPVRADVAVAAHG